jgi:hypothetical protein
MGNYCSGLFDSSREIPQVKDLSSVSRERPNFNNKEHENQKIEANIIEKKGDINLDKNYKEFDSKLRDFYDKALKRHNHYRKKHGVAELKLNLNICKISQKFAEEIAQKNEIFHSKSQWKDLPLGECMAIMIGKELSAEEMTDIWYSEKSNYEFNNPTYKQNSGYFSQIVWKSTEEVGFGISQGADERWVGIANYYPSGNVMGDFENNVFPETS